MSLETTGTSFRFDVTIDGATLGSFTSCEGLAAEYDVIPYQEGGENGYEHRLPGRLKLSTIKLSRPLDALSARTAGGLASWFSEMATKRSRTTASRTASITAYGPGGAPIAQWNLLDAFPLKWTGPSFSADGNAVVKETLELAHHGFIS